MHAQLQKQSPAVPTAIWQSQLTSGSAHCDLELADEVLQCQLSSEACEEEAEAKEEEEEEENASSDKI
eukprot:s117_g43.t1